MCLDICSRRQITFKIGDFRKPIRNSNKGKLHRFLYSTTIWISNVTTYMYLLFVGILGRFRCCCCCCCLSKVTARLAQWFWVFLLPALLYRLLGVHSPACYIGVPSLLLTPKLLALPTCPIQCRINRWGDNFSM